MMDTKDLAALFARNREGDGFADVTPAAVLTALEAMTAAQQEAVRAAIGAGTVQDVADAELVHKLQNARFADHPVTLVHLSDLHDDAAALGRITAQAAALGQMVDGMICTGDMVAGSARYYQSDGITIDTSKAHNGSEGADFANWWDGRVMTVIGNHDAAHQISGSGLVWNAVSMEDKAAFYMDPFASGWGITRTQGTTYYYKDYSAASLRLIVLDTTLTGSDLTTQDSWLAALLSDAITNSLHVLIAAHSPNWGADLLQGNWSDVNSKDPYPTTWTEHLPQSVVDAVHTAQEDGLHFVGYLIGHQHQDGLYDVTGDRSQMAFAVTTANTYARVQWKDADQWRSNSGNDAYNLVTVDTDRSLVKLIRAGGADLDNLLRPREMLCWDYERRRDVNTLALAEAVSGLHDTKQMVITYDDDSTETLRLWCD